MKTVEELRKLDAKKLMAELEEAKKLHFRTEFDVRAGHSKNSHLISKYRKYVAQVKTVMREQELNATPAEEKAAA